MAEVSATRASAPGRVNLIGEHTDYNGGFVLPAAIPQRTIVEIALRAGPDVDAWSATLDDRQSFTLGLESPRRSWIDYVQGVTSVLAAAGHPIAGFTLTITSTVPPGSGLSSSAALEIALLRALREAFHLPLTDEALAAFGHRAENEFVGAPVGIMDHMACSFADETHALLLDARTLAHEPVPLPPRAALLVINSGLAHQHAAGDYRTRRKECEDAAARLGVRQLRDLATSDLGRISQLPDPLSRRARHVVTENARVIDTVRALRDGDLQAAGRLFQLSHASMRDDFNISIPEIDLLVEIAAAESGVFGARLTGGGFGGSIVALAAADRAADAAARIADAYERRSGHRATVLVPSLVT
jgi:galactokinase